jgi:hypothetical protein
MSRIIKNMPFPQYCELDAWNASKIKKLAESPMSFIQSQKEHAASHSMGLGTLVHSLVLEPSTVDDEYIVLPETRTDAKGNEVKFVKSGKYWESFRADIGTCTAVSAADWEKANLMAQNVLAHPLAAKLLAAASDRELTIEFDSIFGASKARIDAAGNGYVLDLKTTATIEPRRFGYASEKFGYDIQSAFYRDALVSADPAAMDATFIFIAVENVAPYDIACYEAVPEVLEMGRRRIRKAHENLQRLDSCGWLGNYTEMEILQFPGLLDFINEEIS